MTSGVCQQQSCFRHQENENKDSLQDFTESTYSLIIWCVVLQKNDQSGGLFWCNNMKPAVFSFLVCKHFRFKSWAAGPPDKWNEVYSGKLPTLSTVIKYFAEVLGCNEWFFDEVVQQMKHIPQNILRTTWICCLNWYSCNLVLCFHKNNNRIKKRSQLIKMPLHPTMQHSSLFH